MQTARFLEFPPPAGGRARFAYPFEWNEPGRRLSQPVEVQWGYSTLADYRELYERCRTKYDYQAPFNLTVYVGRLGSCSARATTPAPGRGSISRAASWT